MTRMAGFSCLVAAAFCLTLDDARAADNALPQVAPGATNDQPSSTSEKESDTGNTPSQISAPVEEPECK